MAKRILTSTEAREFAAYCARYPIDDESNSHVPIASLQSQVAGMMGGKAKLSDYLVFRPREEVPLDSQLVSKDW